MRPTSRAAPALRGAAQGRAVALVAQEAAQAIERLEQAAAARDSGLLLAQTDPLLDPIRTMPEFSQLLSKMGLA